MARHTKPHERSSSDDHVLRSRVAWWPRTPFLLLVLLAGSGCASVRLPAIDPSGDRIFLPKPNSTTLESCTPKPAFAPPPKPQPCAATELGATAPVSYAPGASCAPAAPAAPPPLAQAAPLANACTVAGNVNGPQEPLAGCGRDQFKVMPSRMVAPVGSEVVLVAGYCGADGHFVMRQPVEWMMAPEGVGMIVQVGDVEPDCLQRWNHQYPRKTTGAFAVSYTSYKPDVLTRGTPSKCDDVRIAKGQTWVSVTSPTEGTSHVTAWSKCATGWERRRQTATIHWIDAQWAFPAPVLAKSGELAALSTTVSRASNSTPHAGWLVHYAVEGLDVRFPNNDTQIEVPTDADGRAAVELAPPASGGGTARVAIQVIRPAQGDSPRMVVGAGATTVTWSAPGLNLQVLAPDTMPIGESGVFRIVVTNQGDLPARDVIVSDSPPPALRYVSSNPAGQWFGDHLEWRLGDVGPRSQHVLDVTYQGQRAGDIRYCARARSAEGLTAENCNQATRIFAPAISVNMSGPPTVAVGGEVQFRIEVTNQSAAPLTNVRLIDRFDPGLAHAQGEQSPLEWQIGTLAPGETKRVALDFIARQPGQLCHVVEAAADGGYTGTAQGCVTAAPPPAGASPANSPLRVQISGAGRQQAGQSVDYTIQVYNAGAAPLSNVRVVYQFGPALQPAEASPGFQASRGQLIWDLREMARDERRTFTVRANCLQPDPAALNRVVASADQAAAQTAELVTEITPPGVGGPDLGNAPPPPPSNAAPTGPAGELAASIAELSDPVQVGQNITYLLRIQNDRDVPHQNINVAITLPEGIDFTSTSISPFRARRLLPDNRTIEMEPIAELRAREALRPIRIEFPAKQPGRLEVRVSISSAQQPTPLTLVEETTVAGN
ncbi:MAG: hypothetical protein U0939_07770 [Pirellulales bacterium]